MLSKQPELGKKIPEGLELKEDNKWMKVILGTMKGG